MLFFARQFAPLQKFYTFMLRRILFLLSINLLIAQYSQAQVTTSSITGTVKSGTNEALAGATITATYQPTGTVYTTTSTSTLR